MKLDKRRILIAGTGSGSGKTTVTAGLLRCLGRRGLRAASFKCGPDYIDPMFHERITGRPAGNLDPFFCGGNTLRWMMDADSSDCDLIVAEGVMGYYDGIGFTSRSSTFDVAAATETPVILVLNCRGLGASAAAVLKGFVEYLPPETAGPADQETGPEPRAGKIRFPDGAVSEAADQAKTGRKRSDSHIRGVIFNQLPERLYPGAAKAAERLGVVPLGCLPPDPRVALASRHLGLVTADEVEDFEQKTLLLAETMERTVDLDALLEIAASAPPVDADPPVFAAEEPFARGTVIAVARDRAFCFIYKENIDMLERLGCRVEYFSPLDDRSLPTGTQGVILSGGYPELYAGELSANTDMLRAIRETAASGIPLIAECGGFLYLQDSLEGADGDEYPMAGVLNGRSRGTGRLGRFGYVALTVRRGGLLGEAGAILGGHEFHYWDSTDLGSDLLAEKPDGSRFWDCGFHTDTMYAGFPHVHFYSCPEACRRFVKKCMESDHV